MSCLDFTLSLDFTSTGRHVGLKRSTDAMAPVVIVMLMISIYIEDICHCD